MITDLPSPPDYHPMSPSSRLLLPHQQRVVEERNELMDRHMKLTAFLTTPTFDALPKAERHRLVAQLHVMGQLGTILDERIDAFQPL